MNTKVSSLGVQPKLWAWESRSQKFLLDSWLQKTGAWGKSKHRVQEQLKVRAAKKEHENMRSICRELCIYQQKALRNVSGRQGMQENLLETNRKNPAINLERVAPPIGDHLGWQNIGIFPNKFTQIKKKTCCYYDVCFYNGHLKYL